MNKEILDHFVNNVESGESLFYNNVKDLISKPFSKCERIEIFCSQTTCSREKPMKIYYNHRTQWMIYILTLRDLTERYKGRYCAACSSPSLCDLRINVLGAQRPSGVDTKGLHLLDKKALTSKKACCGLENPWNAMP